MTLGLSAVGLAGLPISLGFTGKWQLATAAIAAGHYWIVGVLVIGTILSMAYLVKAIAPFLAATGEASTDNAGDARAADRPATDDPAADRPATTAAYPRLPALARTAAFALGVLTVATGFLGVWTTRLLEVGAPW